MSYPAFLFGLAVTVAGSALITFIHWRSEERGRRALGIFAITGMVALLVFVPTWRLKLLFGLWFLLAIVGNLWREHRRRVNLVPEEVTRAP